MREISHSFYFLILMKKEKKKNYCIDCGKEICLESIRCHSCANHELWWKGGICSDIKAYMKAYYKSHRTEILKRQQTPEVREYQRHYKKELREKAIEILGGKCMHCGIDDSIVLEFAHKNRDGKIDRLNKHPEKFYKDIINGNEPTPILLLCCNCHIKYDSKNKRRSKNGR